MADDPRAAKSELRPRAEAQPICWEDLTKAQQDAAKNLTSLLDYQVQHAPAVSRFHARTEIREQNLSWVLPPIERERDARVYLLEGDRGTGKTALLVSLIHHWNQLAQGSKEYFCELPGSQDTVFIPIALMDLRLLPKQTALTVHLASLLRRLYDHLAARPRDSVPLPTSPHMTPDPLRQTWELFVTATAASEIEFSRRAANVDPETFAAEIHAAEQDRFDLSALFANLIDVLVKEFHHRNAKKVLFLIAIDDADMNPEHVVPCLELTQMFTHPRVAYVLTGHDDLFRVALEDHFTKALPNAPMEVVQLARKFYDKSIPKAHRQHLIPLELAERIKRARTKLEAFALGSISLDKLMDMFPALALSLPSSMRELLDFEAGMWKNEHQLIHEILLAQRDEATPEGRQVLDRVLSRPMDLAGSIVDDHDASHVSLHVETAAMRTQTFSRKELPLEKVVARKILGFYPMVDGDADVGKPAAPLSSWTGVHAALLLAILVAESSQGTEVHPCPRVVSITVTGDGLRLSSDWPFPRRGVLQAMLFGHLWGRYLRRSDNPPDIDTLGRAYFECQLHASRGAFDATVERTSWEQLMTMAGNGEGFASTQMLLLAAPESGLSSSARRQLLEAWHVTAGDAWFSHVQNARDVRLARMNETESGTARAIFGDDDPWFVVMEYADEDLGPLRAILARPLALKSPWALSSLWEYLTEDLRLMLRKHPDAIERFVEALGTEDNVDIRQKLSSLVPLDLMRWDGTRLYTNGHVTIYPEIWGRTQEVEARGVRCSYALADGALSWPNVESSAARVAFLLALDLAVDLQADIAGSASGGNTWPLIRVENLENGHLISSWPHPPWKAHYDVHQCVTGWAQIRSALEAGPTTLGVIAREYFRLQISVLERKQFEVNESETWASVIEDVEDALARLRSIKHPRIQRFEIWAKSLLQFLAPTSLLPAVDFVGLARELRRSLIPINECGWICDTALALLPDAEQRKLAERVSWEGLEVILDALYEQFNSEFSHEFAPPATRVAAANQMVSWIVESGLKASDDTTADLLLTQDLRRRILQASTSDIEWAMEALTQRQSSGVIDALVDAWRVSDAERRNDVLWSGGHLVVQGSYHVEEVFSDPGVFSTAIPGLTVRYYRGGVRRRERHALADVFHALLHDIAQSNLAAEPAPIQWPLARYDVAGQNNDVSPWPQVQWPQRVDTYRQLVCWNAALGHRSGDVGSLSMLVRRFIAATADIFEYRRINETSPGSWKDVLSVALNAARIEPKSARDHAYVAWTQQLARFALPRVGLSKKHAADLLVRLWDVTKADPQPQITGRIDEYRKGRLKLHTPPDHPALLLAAEPIPDLAGVAAFMNQLRKTYELG
jgi:hypothetical protein